MTTHIQRGYGNRLRLVDGTGVCLAVATTSGGGVWTVNVYVYDREGRSPSPFLSGCEGTRDEVAGWLESAAPSLEAAHRLHLQAAAALGEVPGIRASGGDLMVPAAMFVRLLGRAAQGDPEVLALLQRASAAAGGASC